MVFRMSRRVTDPGRFLFSSLLIIASLLKTVFHKFGRVSCYSFARCFASPLYLGEEGQGTGAAGVERHYTFSFFTWSAAYSEVRQARAMMVSVGFLSALLTKGAPSVIKRFLQSHAWQ